jgi:hypothetical protein
MLLLVLLLRLRRDLLLRHDRRGRWRHHLGHVIFGGRLLRSLGLLGRVLNFMVVRLAALGSRLRLPVAGRGLPVAGWCVGCLRALRTLLLPFVAVILFVLLAFLTFIVLRGRRVLGDRHGAVAGSARRSEAGAQANGSEEAGRST